MRPFHHPLKSFAIICLLALAACAGPDQPVDQPDTATLPPEAAPTATQPTSEPLTICLGQEPNTLFPYGRLNDAARMVLQAVYDGPIDELDYQYMPAVLEELPAFENGGVRVEPVVVQAGDRVVSEDGSPIALGSSAVIRPSGCAGGDCVLVYENGEVVMDQLVVTFRLKAGLTWSDGTPLTAGDSVYAHRINANPINAASQFHIQRTVSYQALDELTIVWTGLPGFVSADYLENFWLPVPEHAWSELDPFGLGETSLSALTPMGWGAYVIENWEAGQEISLRSNPNYFRASEGLPLHDELIFRFVGQDGPENLARLQSGECDLLGPDTGLESIADELIGLGEAGEIQTAFAQSDQWWHLDFGIQHIDYTDGYNQGLGDRPNYFEDVRVRQAFAQCINRQALLEQFAWGQGSVMDSYLPPNHPLSTDQTPSYTYDSQAAGIVLETVGWIIGEDGVRVSQGVAGVLDGTRFEIGYLAADTVQDQTMVNMIAADLQACGIQVTVETQPAETLFANGPTGPIFGRQFDLAQFAWPLQSQPACYLYLSEAIPGDDLDEHSFGWGGWNATGWQNLEFDLACKTARNSLPGDVSYVDDHQNAQSIFAENLPVIPLFADVAIVAGRADLCGLDFDDTAGAIWNVESLGFGEYCP